MAYTIELCAAPIYHQVLHAVLKHTERDVSFRGFQNEEGHICTNCRGAQNEVSLVPLHEENYLSRVWSLIVLLVKSTSGEISNVTPAVHDGDPAIDLEG